MNLPSPTSTGAPAIRRFRPAHTALICGAVTALTLVMAALDGNGQTALLAAVLPLSLLVGTLMGLLHARNLRSMLWGTGLGLLVGVLQTVDILGWNVYGSFALSVATLALFGGIGFIIGTFVEFVQLLHFVAHGGKVTEYRRR